LSAPGSGWLLVCSDGLWNYCSGASDLAVLVAQHTSTDPTVLAEFLVAWANEQGGHDNITAALARVDRVQNPVSPAPLPLPSEKIASEDSPDNTHADTPQTRSS
jgi:serine/threonine protein phosphatase PrpC